MNNESERGKKLTRVGIVASAKAGMTIEDIAKFYGISPAAVELVLETSKDLMDNPK